MAARLELAVKNYQRLERGRQNPTLRTIVKVSTALDASAEASGAGEILLVEHGDLHDPETGASYTVKRVFLGERREGRRRVRFARLVSANPWYGPIDVELSRHSEQRLRVVARFVEV